MKVLEVSKITEESLLPSPHISQFNIQAFNEVAKYLDTKTKELL